MPFEYHMDDDTGDGATLYLQIAGGHPNRLESRALETGQ